MLGLLASPLARPLLAGVALIAVVAAIYARGSRDGVSAEHGREAKLQAAAEADIHRREADAGRIAEAAHAQVAAERTAVEVRTRTLIQRIPVHVTPDDDRRCSVNAGFVRVHDAAAGGSAAGEVPGSAGGPDAAASGVPLSSVLGTVVANYGVAYDWRAEALGWRAWYVNQKAAWEAPAPAPRRRLKLPHF
jgi:hypothetical protein